MDEFFRFIQESERERKRLIQVARANYLRRLGAIEAYLF